MTTEELKQYYANLLILQYVGVTDNYDCIKALVGMIIMDQLPLDVQAAFAIGTAVGVQLDTLGKFAGVTRSGYGVDGSNITLTDDDFRILIQVAIIRNTSGSSLATIQDLLFRYFPNQIFVFDYANMQMSYVIDSTLGSFDMVQLFVTEGLLPKPMGVQLAAVIYVIDPDNVFGFGTYQLSAYNVHGFNTYLSYDTDCPWLTYQNAVG